MSTVLSPVFGAGWQLLDNQGRILSGGKIYTYVAGTTTPTTTWVDPYQNVEQSNPIILDESGRLENEMWLLVGSAYKFRVTDKNDVVVGYVLDNIQPTDLTVSETGALLTPLGGADSVMVNGWSEFAYATTPVINDSGQSDNAIYDEIIRSIPLDSLQSDFTYVQRDDIPRSLARKLVLWYQWVSLTDAMGAAAPQVSYNFSMNHTSDPDQYVVDCTNQSGPRWNMNGDNSNTAVPVGPNISNQPGGTPADTAFVEALRTLTTRGYSVGVCPIVTFYDPSKYATGDFFVWRGLAEWPDLTTFNAWRDYYVMMHKHLAELFTIAFAQPWVWYIGSEMRWLSADSPADIRASWYLALQDLADYIKSLFPTCVVTYSGSDYEVGYYNGDWSMDALWSHPSVDYVGYSWYKPLYPVHTNDYQLLKSGVLSNERIDYYTDYSSMEPYRWLSNSDGTGKSGIPLLQMNPAQSWQNGSMTYQLTHYSNRGSDLAGATPVAGSWRGHPSAILSDLTGTCILAKDSTVPLEVGPGSQPTPLDTDYYLTCDGVSQYVSATFPNPIAAPITSYWIRLNFAHLGAAGTFPRAMRVQTSGGTTLFDIEMDRTVPTAVPIKFRYEGTSAHYYTITTVDETAPVQTDIEVYVTETQAVLYLNGAIVNTHTLSDPPNMPSDEAKLFLGARDAVDNFCECYIYVVAFEGYTANPNLTVGAAYYFEDEYAGIRSPWVPGSKPPMATEVGFASMQGSCVEPNVFPQLKYGAGTLPSPYWFTDYYYWVGQGIEDIYGPVNGLYNQDQYHQSVCLKAAIDGLKEAGFVHQVAYNIDTRPAGAMLAKISGVYYFGDGLSQRISHTVNGKLAGGNSGATETVFDITPSGPSYDTSTGQCKIWMVRHADTEKDIDGNYIRSFTPTGLAQVTALPAKLAALGVSFDYVIVSPAWRTMNTIKPWLVSNNLVAEIWPEIYETSYDDANTDTQPRVEGGIVLTLDDQKNFKVRDPSWGSLSTSIPVQARPYASSPEAGKVVCVAASDLFRQRWNGKGKNILMVGHYHTGSRIIELLQGGTADTYDPNAPLYPVGNTEISSLYQNCSTGYYILETYKDGSTYGGSPLPDSSPNYPGSFDFSCW